MPQGLGAGEDQRERKDDWSKYGASSPMDEVM